MALPSPRMPPYDIRDWQRRPFAERLRMVCQCWAIHGYGTPWPVYLFYVFKGNLVPSAVSFLCSMRYYAGNWAWSVWLFRGDASRRLDTHLVKAAPHVRDQLLRFYGDEVAVAALSKVMAFRAMHLHGRALQLLLPRVVADIEEYEYVDGELVAGLVLGWNFGDGHLHDEQLLRAIQRQCHFAEGELRCLFVESQPLGRGALAWRIHDAAGGERERGTVEVAGLTQLQPWPAAPSAPPLRAV